MVFFHKLKFPIRIIKTAPGLIFLLFAATALANQAHIDSLNNPENDFIFSNIALAIEQYRNLAEESRSLDYEYGEAQALKNLAIAYALNGLSDESVQANLQAIRLLEKNNMLEDLAQAYGDLGYQMKRRDLPRAKKYMRLAITIAEQNNFKVRLCALYDNYGILQEMDAKLDSAAYFINRALALKFELKDSNSVSFSLSNLASIHSIQEEYAVAESLLTLSDTFHQRPDDTYVRLLSRVNWGDLKFKQKQFSAAEEFYLQSLEMPGALEQNFLIIHCYGQLALIYEELEDFTRAYRSQQRFTAYRDSLVTVDTNTRIANLEIEFETEKKDRQLTENKLTMEARKRQLIMLGALAVLLAATGLGILRYQQLKRHQLRNEMKLRGHLRKAEYEQRMSDEKLRISRELHDNIGSQLTFLISSMDNLSLVSKGNPIQDKLNSISNFGRTTLSELRQTVWAMKHESDGLDALVLKLHELKRQCSGTLQALNLEINCDKDVPTRMSSAQILSIYRIAQEAVQNAVKHSQANNITVGLSVNTQGLTLTIVDDGKGFENNQVSQINGLKNMEHRCAEVGGQFNLQSDEYGTRVSCSFPPE